MKTGPALSPIILLCLYLSLGQATLYSEAQFKELVATKYLSAINNYNDILGSIVDQLKDYNPETSLPKEIDPAVANATEDFFADLTAAFQNVESMSQSLDPQVGAASAKVSRVESQIQQEQSKIETARVQIQQKEKEITLARQKINVANANVAQFDHAAYVANKKKEKEECHCFRRRRKRDDLDDILKGIERKFRCDFKKQICKVSNETIEALEKAKKDLRMARENLASAKSHLEQATTDKNLAIEQQVNAKPEVTRLTNEREGLLATLATTKTKRDRLVDISANLNNTLSSIGEFTGQDHDLKTNVDLTYLLDVDGIVVPLREVGQKIAILSGTPGQAGFLPSLTLGQIFDIRQKLAVISKNAASTGPSTSQSSTTPVRTSMSTSTSPPSPPVPVTTYPPGPGGATWPPSTSTSPPSPPVPVTTYPPGPGGATWSPGIGNLDEHSS